MLTLFSHLTNGIPYAYVRKQPFANGFPSRVDDNGQIPPAWLRVQVRVPGTAFPI